MNGRQPVAVESAVVPRPGGAAAPAGDNGPYPPITIKVASTRAEREGAFRLVYQRYLGAGLCPENDRRLRVTPYQLLDTTGIFVALYKGEVIFTQSLVGDGERGVPMEDAFPDEIRDLRSRGIRFGEVSCMADRRRELTRFLPLFVRVVRLMFQYARWHGCQRVVIAVHPKHGRFYERYFGFRQMGGERQYETVQNKPAVAYSLDWAWLSPERHEQFFGEPVPPDELRPQPWSGEDLAHFSPAALPLGRSELLSGGYELSPGDAESVHDAPKSQAATDTVRDRPGLA